MNWPLLALVGGIVGLDATSFPQAMISRPLVAGVLTGLVLGMPVEGALLGAFLEIFHLGILPIGASRYPEAGTATVAATVAYAAVPPFHGTAGLLLAIVFALTWERVTGASIILFRHNVERLLFAFGREARSPRELEQRHLMALGTDALRGCIVSLAGAALGSLLLPRVAPFWTLDESLTRAAIILAAATGLGGSLTVFGGWSVQYRLFLFGAVCGTLLLFLQ